MKALRTNIYYLLHYNPGRSGLASRVIVFSIQALILLNVLAVILESVQEVRETVGLTFFIRLEQISLTVFVVEYLLRMWTCIEDKRFRRPILGRLRYAVTPLAIVDLLAISSIFVGGVADLRVLRLLRMLRLLRLAKMARYSQALNILGRVIKKQKEELTSSLFIFVVIVIVTSALAYYAEGEAQPDRFSSIPAAMWWAVITFTTVGYGDVVPITLGGKLIAAVTSILGIAMFGLIAGVLVTGFMAEFRDRRRVKTRQEKKR